MRHVSATEWYWKKNMYHQAARWRGPPAEVPAPAQGHSGTAAQRAGCCLGMCGCEGVRLQHRQWDRSEARQRLGEPLSEGGYRPPKRPDDRQSCAGSAWGLRSGTYLTWVAGGQHHQPSDPVGVRHGEAPRRCGAPIMAHHGCRLDPQRLQQCSQRNADLLQAVAGDICRFVAQAVARHIWAQDAVAGGGEGCDLRGAHAWDSIQRSSVRSIEGRKLALTCSAHSAELSGQPCRSSTGGPLPASTTHSRVPPACTYITTSAGDRCNDTRCRLVTTLRN
jgi:hypothetical protein